MRVAVLGMGPIGLGSAMLLATHGHEPVLWSPRRSNITGLTKITVEGALENSTSVSVAGSCAEALSDADAVVLAVPATAYEAVFDQVAAVLRPGQAVLVSGHLSFGALYLSKLLTVRGVAAPIAAWGTTVVSGRRLAPDRARLSSVRNQVDLAALPATATKSMLELCRTLFGDRFRSRSGLLAVTLSNVNPQNHLAIALCNFTRIERAETWTQSTNITPSVGRLLEALDQERLAIADVVGEQVRTLRQHFHLSYDVGEAPLDQMASALVRKGLDPAAPKSIETRYVLEDAPFGLYPTILLGRIFDRPARLHEAGLLTLSALYGRDLSQENAIIPALGLAGLMPATLTRLTEVGWPN